jgi:predicted nucleic acid-binding protein
MRFVDTNVFIRYLTRDDPQKAEACRELFERVDRGEEEIATCEAVVTEIVYILSARAHYGMARAAIAQRVLPLLAMRGLRVPYKQTLSRALHIYAANTGLDFEDAVIVAHMGRTGITEVLSYDEDFDGVSGVTRVEP